MSRLGVYADLVEDVREQGRETIQVIDAAKGWECRVNPSEVPVRDMFNHALKALSEAVENWCLHDSAHFAPSRDPAADLDRTLARVQRALQGLQDADLDGELVLPWGRKTTLGGGLRLFLLHAVGHFAQVRNWAGIKKRAETKPAAKRGG